jgi:N-acyl-D-amino-acid deacylase
VATHSRDQKSRHADLLIPNPATAVSTTPTVHMAESQDGDIVFHDATVVDGSGAASFQATVVVRDGLIHTISVKTKPVSESSNVRIIDCENGRWSLCPGFIDMHAHSDLSLLHTPEHLAKVTQGVTTEVVGQDGISYAPVDDAAMQRIRKQIAGWNGNPTKPADFFDRWRTVEEYLDVLDKGLDGKGIATNAAFLVPQGNLRILTVGYDSREATADEIDKMKEILTISLEQGAVGMSSGLTYVPGNFATFKELAELCKVLVKYGAYYCPHHRSYGANAMKAYAEMIQLARETGVRLHLTHATLNYPENIGRADELLKMIDDAIADGVQISLDTYPYLPGSTTLAAQLPTWAASATDKLAVLNDPEQLAKIKHECSVKDPVHGVALDFTQIEIGGVFNNALAEQCVGKRISEIASERGEDSFDTFIWLLKEDDFSSTILSHVGNEDNVRKIMRSSVHTGGSDGILTSTKPHPRGWGTFPRYVGHYHRDLAQGKSRNIYAPKANIKDGPAEEFEIVEAERLFDGGLEEVVHHITGRAAAVVRIKDRGLVKEGYRADLVLFDAESIRDKATFIEPKQAAQGIRSVLVNGVFAVDEGKATGARAGRTVRMRKGDSGGGWIVSY